MNTDSSCKHQRPANPPQRQTHTRLWLFQMQKVASFSCQSRLLGWHSSLQTTQWGTVLRWGRWEGAWGGADVVVCTHP